MEEYKGSPALDAGLLAAAQAVEHYEISRYGTLKAWAEELGLEDAAGLLQETLEEEEATDEALTEIAKSAITGARVPLRFCPTKKRNPSLARTQSTGEAPWYHAGGGWSPSARLFLLILFDCSELVSLATGRKRLTPTRANDG
jgi:hypothetical protein